MSLFLIISSDESKTLITNAFFTRNEDYNFEQSKDYKKVYYFFVSATDS